MQQDIISTTTLSMIVEKGRVFYYFRFVGIIVMVE